MFEVYFESGAFERAQELFKSNATRGLEALGFLVGRIYSFKGRNYVVVKEFITAENDATSVSVRFSRQAFSELSRQFKEEKSGGGVIVGWAHSHPNYGCFLSSTDFRTQKAFFPEDFHFALVCDPIRSECKVFKINGSGYEEVSFAVVKKKMK